MGEKSANLITLVENLQIFNSFAFLQRFICPITMNNTFSFLRSESWSGLPDISWYNVPKRAKNVPNEYKITKCSLNIPNGS
jgi:hypothetical protein